MERFPCRTPPCTMFPLPTPGRWTPTSSHRQCKLRRTMCYPFRDWKYTRIVARYTLSKAMWIRRRRYRAVPNQGQPHPGEIVLLLLLRKKSKNRKVWNYKLFVNAERAVSSCPSRILSRTKNFGYGCHVPEFLSQRSRKAAAPALGQPEWIAEKSISYAAGRFRRVRWKISPTNRPTAAGQIQPNPSSKKGR